MELKNVLAGIYGRWCLLAKYKSLNASRCKTSQAWTQLCKTTQDMSVDHRKVIRKRDLRVINTSNDRNRCSMMQQISTAFERKIYRKPCVAHTSKLKFSVTPITEFLFNPRHYLGLGCRHWCQERLSNLKFSLPLISNFSYNSTLCLCRDPSRFQKNAQALEKAEHQRMLSNLPRD